MTGRTPNSGFSATIFFMALLLTGASFFLGYNVLTSLSEQLIDSTKYALVLLVYIVPLVLVEVNASVFIPDLMIGGMQVRLLAMTVIGMVEINIF